MSESGPAPDAARKPGTDDDRTFFFLHVMKTAGTSFAQHIPANFGPEETYPSPATPEDDRREQYWKIAPLRSLDPQVRARTRIFHGHHPLLVADMVGADTILTILRDPVERTISHIRHCQRHHPGHGDASLEEVYRDGWLHPLLFRNYQVKQFALTPADDPKAHNEDVMIDAERLELAMANLERVDLLGFTDRYDDFVTEVAERFGWTIAGRRRLQAAPDDATVPASLREQIVEDNQPDIEFYEHARRTWLARAGGSAG